MSVWAAMGSVAATVGPTLAGALVALDWRLIFLVTSSPRHRAVVTILPGLVLTGAGAGLAQPGFLSAGSSVLPAEVYGMGTGILNAARQLGTALGVAALIAVTTFAPGPAGFRMAWAGVLGSGLAAAFLSVLVGAARRRAARRDSEVLSRTSRHPNLDYP